MVNTVSAVSLPPLVADRAVTETPARDMTSDSTSIIPDRIINRMNGWGNAFPARSMESSILSTRDFFSSRAAATATFLLICYPPMFGRLPLQKEASLAFEFPCRPGFCYVIINLSICRTVLLIRIVDRLSQIQISGGQRRILWISKTWRTYWKLTNAAPSTKRRRMSTFPNHT